MDYQWRVFQAYLDPTIGREQAGERPVLVVSAEPLNEVYDVVMVVPITSRKNNRPPRLGEVLLPEGVAGLRTASFALCYQVRTLDKSRLGRFYGSVNDPALQQSVVNSLSLCLDVNS